MSGEDLRNACIQGDKDMVKHILKHRANACSADEYGLTALMIAVWNGHIECIKLIAANPLGINKDGERDSVLNMVTCKGYTALHLIAIMDDGEMKAEVVKEIAHILLLVGSDPSIRCKEGFSVQELSLKNHRWALIERLKYFASAATDMDVKMELDNERHTFRAKYGFHVECQMQVEPWKSTFPLPDFLFEPQRAGAIPEGMKVLALT